MLDRTVSPETRYRRVAEAATAYLARLVESNSHRVENDLKDRVRESRRALEGRIRRSLLVAGESAERALALAEARHMMEAGQIQERLSRLDLLEGEVGKALTVTA
jgi:hypothetical protein